MSWDYADLSKMAKKCGGPEMLVEELKRGAYIKGQKSMWWLLPAGMTLGGGIVTCIIKGIKGIKGKKLSDVELRATEEELIQGIKQFDATHSEEVTPNNEEFQEEKQ